MKHGFHECTTNGPKNWESFLQQCRDNGVTAKLSELKGTWEMLQRCQHYRNDTYHVAVDRQTEHGFEDMVIWHLSIKRHDRKPVHDWREMQKIKNAICGDGVEAMELYPAESRVVDTANQYHMYAFIQLANGEYGPTIPVGFMTGMKTNNPNFGNAQQRPRDEEEA